MEKNQLVKTISHSIQKRCRDWRSESGKNAKAHSSVKHLITHTNSTGGQAGVRDTFVAIERETTAPVLSDMQEKASHRGFENGKNDRSGESDENLGKCLIIFDDCWVLLNDSSPLRLAFIYIGTVNIYQRTVTLNRKLKKVSKWKMEFSPFLFASANFFSFIEHSFLLFQNQTFA